MDHTFGVNRETAAKPLPVWLAEICSAAPERVPVCRPMLPDFAKVSEYVRQVDTSRRYSNHGRLALTLQDRLRASIDGVAHVVVAASGTAALTGAILAYAGRAKPDKKLCLVPAYTFIGTVSAIEQCGYTPYFVDVDPLTWMIEPRHCANHRLLDTVGLVVPVAPYGRPVPQEKWSLFSRHTGIPVVIDGAATFESLLSAPTSYLGPVPVAVSFHATKSFCTGEGGAVFCGDPEMWRPTMQCLNFGYDVDRVCRRPSINGKMSEYHAAVGLAELDQWHCKLSLFARAANHYRSAFRMSEETLHLAPSVASNYVLLEARSVARARDVMDILGHNGIGHRMWYGSGVHRHPYCATFGGDDLPIAEDLASRLIGLPMSVDLKLEDVSDIAGLVNSTGALHPIAPALTRA